MNCAQKQFFCWAPDLDNYVRRYPEDIRGVVVHRIEVSQEDPSYCDSPEDVLRFFLTHPIGRQATGGAIPYPLLIDVAGSLAQTVPLSCVTPHARTHNPSTVGVALIGDFRGRSPTLVQRQQLVYVCAHLLGRFGLTEAALHGHDELVGGSRDPDKECPGSHLPMDALRHDVSTHLGVCGPPLTIQWEKE